MKQKNKKSIRRISENPDIGKKHALKKYNQFAINTSCFWGEVAVKYYPVVQFHEIFVTKIIYKVVFYYKY